MSDQITSPGVAKGHLSKAVPQLAKVLDRLPHGEFIVVLTKPDRKGSPWQIAVRHVEVIRVFETISDDQV